MTRNNIKNYFVMFVLILSASSMVENHAFATNTLGTASTFGVLGASTVTNTGLTTITGDLGVSPGTAITGFPPGTVSGTIHTGSDPVAVQAHNDAVAAYGALSSATCTTIEPTVADIGGQTLGPGVYCFPSSAAITGTLTLNGNGVYIFEIGSTLVTASASNVVLTGGASASDVFWQVGSSATLGTGSVMEGTIIALASITSTTGTTVDGRLIALNGAVTLDTNNITVVGNTGFPVPPQVTSGKVTGGGSTSLEKGKDLNFGFVVNSDKSTTPTGNMEFQSKLANINLHSTSFYSLSVYSSTLAVFSGTATINGVSGHTFKVTVEDNGEPGTSDKFSIEIDGGAYSTSGTLTAGNIQIHKN